MTEEQKKYYNAMKKLGSKKPQKPIPRPLVSQAPWQSQEGLTGALGSSIEEASHQRLFRLLLS